MTGVRESETGTRDLETRIRGECLEMPGQRLTIAQASRLWGLEERSCATLLDGLVGSGFLRRVGPYYFRADLGRLSA